MTNSKVSISDGVVNIFARMPGGTFILVESKSRDLVFVAAAEMDKENDEFLSKIMPLGLSTKEHGRELLELTCVASLVMLDDFIPAEVVSSQTKEVSGYLDELTAPEGEHILEIDEELEVISGEISKDTSASMVFLGFVDAIRKFNERNPEELEVRVPAAEYMLEVAQSLASNLEKEKSNA